MGETGESSDHGALDGRYPERRYEPGPEAMVKPTYWPAVLAAGITLLAWGVVTSYILSVLGLGFTVVSLANWIGDMRRGQELESE